MAKPIVIHYLHSIRAMVMRKNQKRLNLQMIKLLKNQQKVEMHQQMLLNQQKAVMLLKLERKRAKRMHHQRNQSTNMLKHG